MVKVTVFVGRSVDGFIARRDGAIDWLPADGGGKDAGFDEFFASVDALVMGRNTFETARGFGAWPYGSKRVVVLTHRPLDTSAFPGAKLEAMAGEPAEVLSRLETTGVRHVYVDGGATIQAFLRAGLVDRLIVTDVPVLIGEGIPLFGRLAQDVRLRHVRTKTLRGGLVQSEYLAER
jgi:dihydrofolate reductase